MEMSFITGGFTPGEKNPFPTKYVAGWAKSQSGHLVSRKISCPCQDLDAEWSSQVA